MTLAKGVLTKLATLLLYLLIEAPRFHLNCALLRVLDCILHQVGDNLLQSGFVHVNHRVFMLEGLYIYLQFFLRCLILEQATHLREDLVEAEVTKACFEFSRG
jgi:hypothetical protein